MTDGHALNTQLLIQTLFVDIGTVVRYYDGSVEYRNEPFARNKNCHSKRARPLCRKNKMNRINHNFLKGTEITVFHLDPTIFSHRKFRAE